MPSSQSVRRSSSETIITMLGWSGRVTTVSDLMAVAR